MSNIKFIKYFMVLMLFFQLIFISSCSVAFTNAAYVPKLPSDNPDMNKVVAHMSEIFKKKSKASIDVKDFKANRLFVPKEVFVFDDRIEFRRKDQFFSLNFKDLINRTISVNGFTITIDNYFSFALISDLPNTKLIADYLYFIQRNFYKNELALKLKKFESIAANYRNSKTKPTVSEEQRKLIVQANAMNQQKLYSNAIELYVKAMETHPTAYPVGYYNIALLNAQIGYFENAIFEMKKYIMLLPDAPDARSAQDKIYEWELMVKE